MQRQAVFVCFASFVILYLINPCQGCIDSLRNERGDLIVREWPQEPSVDYEEDVVIFKTKAGALILPEKQTEAPLDECKVTDDLLYALLESHAYYIKKVFPNAWPGDTLRQIDDSTIVVVPDLSNDFMALLEEDTDIYEAIHILCGQDSVIWAEPNGVMHPFRTPNDQYYAGSQWNLKSINYGIDCVRAWDASTGVPAVKIGILGSGIDASHPDLANKVLGGANYNDMMPPDQWGDDGHNNGHETKVAGIVGARTNNQIGIAGIAGGWNSGPNDIGAIMYSLRGTDSDGIMYADDHARAIWGADDFDCDIINICWGDASDYFVIHEAVVNAQSQRRTIVAAMGNGGSGYDDHHVYPAEYEDNWIIAVGSYGQDGIYCHEDPNANCPQASNFGYPIDVVAPGVNIAATAPGNSYVTNFGATSGATPHATGTAALILSKKPGSWSEDIDWLIKKTAEDAGPGGYDEHYGWGRLDAGYLLYNLLGASMYTGKIHRFVEFASAPSRMLLREEWTRFYGESSLDPSRLYDAECYRATYHISFPKAFTFILGAWGSRFGYIDGELVETTPWSQSNPNLTVGYCEVDPNTITQYGCNVITHFFRVLVSPNNWQWYPHHPDYAEATLCFSFWGYINDTP